LVFVGWGWRVFTPVKVASMSGQTSVGGGGSDLSETMWRLLWDSKGLVDGGLAVCNRSSVRPRLLAARKLSSVNPQRLAVSRFSGLSVSVGWVGGFPFS
jgi:hypothetical protein